MEKKFFDTLDDFKNTENIEGLRFYRATAHTIININQHDLEILPGEIYLMSPQNHKTMPPQLFVEMTGDTALLHKPYRGEDLSGKKVLVARSGGIGDLLFIQPSLRYLKKKYPTCRFMFGTSTSNVSLVASWDCVSEAFPLPLSLKKLQECDYFMNFFGLIEYCKEAEKKNAYLLFSEAFGLTGLEAEYLRPMLEPRKPRVKKLHKDLASKGLDNGYVYVQIKSSSINRTPHLSIYFVIFERLMEMGLQVVICDRACDSAYMDAIIDAFFDVQRSRKSPLAERYSQLVNLSKYSQDLHDMIAIISCSRFVIAPDSSSLHIAGGLGIPFYGMFTSFPAELRVSTYQDCNYTKTTYDPSICEKGGRNCFLHGDKICNALESGQPKCFLSQIKIDEIVNCVKRYFPVN